MIIHAGNGMEFCAKVTDGCVLITSEKQHIDTHTKLISDLFLLIYLYAIIATIEDALILIICFLERIQIICKIVLRKIDIDGGSHD